jgi:hypothetical protein
MNLTDQEKRDMLEDGLSVSRRDAFRSMVPAPRPATFEEYIAILDDMASLAPHPARPPFVTYLNVKL